MPSYSIFEALPFASKAQLGGIYYQSLLPHVHSIEGFRGDAFLVSLSSDRRTPRKGVNVAVWDDLEAIRRWREEANHLRLQGKGAEVYRRYRLRIGEGETDSEISNEGEGVRHYVTLLYFNRNDEGQPVPDDDVTHLLDDDAANTLQQNLLESAVYADKQTTLWISSWSSADAVVRFRKSILSSKSAPFIRELVVIRILRDYSKTDRKDAPSKTPGGPSARST